MKQQSIYEDKIILVVEDDPIIQNLMKKILENFGLEVYFASDGKKGIAEVLKLYAESRPPNLILMDIRMPGMDGIETTQQIYSLSECQEIPIVAVSADAYSEQKEQALASGMVDYLSKPFRAAELEDILKKHL